LILYSDDIRKMSRAKFLPLFLAFLLTSSLASASAQAPSPTPMPDLQSADALGEQMFLQSGATGMVLVVVRGKEVFFRGYGETAPGSHQPPTEDSVLRLCSLTKTFTTDLLTKLAEDNTVQLKDPLQRFAPPDVVVPERGQPITLLDLATHTAGLPRELTGAPANTPHFTFPDYATRWRSLPNQHLRSIPGTSASYSNLGFDFLSDALADATHKQYAALLAERTLSPLHMWNTTFFPSAAQCSRLLRSAHDEGPCTVTEATAGSSGLYSTASDMTIWLRYLLGSDEPAIPAQDPAAQAIYLRPLNLVHEIGLSHAGEPTGVGLAWVHILPEDSPSHIVQKTGGGAGFLTYIALNHARHAAVFVAATDGSIESHENLFYSANQILLAMAGLPPLPQPPPRRVHKRAHVHRASTKHRRR
jgi:serine-type D-Ala-D-Ala carboxypeptidase/endopeptidase